MNNSIFLKIATMVLLSVALSMFFIGVVGCIASYADFAGVPDSEDSVPFPVCSTWHGDLYFTYSMSPFELSSDMRDLIHRGEYAELLSREASLGTPTGLWFYNYLSYSFNDVSGDKFVECEASPEEPTDETSILYFPIMSNSSSRPIVLYVYPENNYVEFTIYARGYRYSDNSLEWDNFEFVVSLESDQYVNNRAICNLMFSELSSYDFISYEVNFNGNCFGVRIPFDDDFNPLFVAQGDIVDVTVVPEPNFLEWVTRSVSAFLNTPIFTIGSVRVTIGVCFLVPLSLYILVAFLKKFSGG